MLAVYSPRVVTFAVPWCFKQLQVDNVRVNECAMSKVRTANASTNGVLTSSAVEDEQNGYAENNGVAVRTSRRHRTVPIEVPPEANGHLDDTDKTLTE